MTARDRLNSKLAKLKGGSGSEEPTVFGGTDGIVAALLAEIDETILPREMVLTNEKGEEARLLVAGRRLLRVGGPGERLDAAQAASGERDAEHGAVDAIAAAFHGTLRGFLDRAEEIGVTARRPGYRVDPTEVGCSVDMLSQPGTEPGGPPAPVADPIAAGLAAARAGLRLSGDRITGSTGDPALAEGLRGFAETALADLTRDTDRADGRLSCRILRAAAPGGMLLAHIARGEDAALLLTPEGALAELLALCRPAQA